ncbi:hypothetical protein GIB67_023987 [Kingdonia uniflora]|uniref:Uncharacterized protein n=1 Tax=Kingdonia uniflora TaxID=39325 RepID=A0A7J7LPE0_9MAGN|nr:hypothetical protein GIB67_023987 [Kingdonia uniflora]
MKGDYFHYLAKFKTDQERKDAADQSLKDYEAASKLKTWNRGYNGRVHVILGGSSTVRVSELLLSNGMRDCYWCIYFVDYQVDLVLDEIVSTSQEKGPSYRDVSTILEIEQQAHENGLQENYYWPMSFFTNPFEHLYLERIFMETIGKLHVQQRGDTPGTPGIGRNMRIACSCKSSFLAAADDSGDIKVMTSFK